MRHHSLYIVIISIFTTICTIGQEHVSNLSISGKISVLVGNEISVPSDVYIFIKSANRFDITDSIGSFSLDSLENKKYRISVSGYGYNTLDTTVCLKSSISNLNLLLIADCDINKMVAEDDIKNNKPRLLLIGGIVPVYISGQYATEKKFGFKYYDFGDTPPATECVVQYNKVVFQYLDKKYGNKWRKEVRQDVVGLKE